MCSNFKKHIDIFFLCEYENWKSVFETEAYAIKINTLDLNQCCSIEEESTELDFYERIIMRNKVE